MLLYALLKGLLILNGCVGVSPVWNFSLSKLNCSTLTGCNFGQRYCRSLSVRHYITCTVSCSYVYTFSLISHNMFLSKKSKLLSFVKFIPSKTINNLIGLICEEIILITYIFPFIQWCDLSLTVSTLWIPCSVVPWIPCWPTVY